MSLITIQPKMVYPKSRQFPFDSLGARIIGELELRYWRVPGIKITVDVYGSGKEKMQRICNIEGEEFLLHFDYEGLREITIPGKQLHVYSDESGPMLYYYVGSDYEGDKNWFKHSIKTNSKLRGEPRRYLRYSGSHNRCGQRAEYLLHDNDLDREYDPKGSEPTKFKVDDIFEEIDEYLQFILDYILQFPELNYDAIPPVEAKTESTYTGIFDKLYVPIDWNMKNHIKSYFNGESIEDKHYYAVEPSHRLCNLRVPRVNDICYDGFVWADPNLNKKEIKDAHDLIRSVEDSQFALGFDVNSVLVVKPKYNNDIYVVDDAEFEKKRQKFFKHTDRLSDDELNECYIARAKTLVPIDKYKGGYECPIVLFNREVEFEEVEAIIEAERS